MKSLKYCFLLLAALTPLLASAQKEVPMADGMRAEGKIYVVVAIVLIVLIGLVAYLFLMDRKVKKLEKLVQDKSKV
jgi:CcmD family protein